MAVDPKRAVEALQGNMTSICDSVVYTEIKDHLYEKKLLSQRQMSRIGEVVGDVERMVQVMELLVKKGEALKSKFIVFLDILDNTGYSHLRDQLMQSYISSLDTKLTNAGKFNMLTLSN